MEANTQGLFREIDELEKEETTFEELKNSTDWEQALLVITDDSFPYSQFIESRTFLVTRFTPYFNKAEASNKMRGINLTFTEFNSHIDEYLEGKMDITFHIEKCYKLRSLFDLTAVNKRIDEITSIRLREEPVSE